MGKRCIGFFGMNVWCDDMVVYVWLVVGSWWWWWLTVEMELERG